MEENKKIDIEAMKIITSSGDGRFLVMEALDLISEFRSNEASLKLNEAYQVIKYAHEVQTRVLQKVANDEKNEYSMLFSHAQDTLMTIYSEYNLAIKLNVIVKNIDNRINQVV